MRVDLYGASKSWGKSLLGNHSLLLAVLRHGSFAIKDLRRCAALLRLGGVPLVAFHSYQESGGNQQNQHGEMKGVGLILARADGVRNLELGAFSKIRKQTNAASPNPCMGSEKVTKLLSTEGKTMPS